MVHLKLTWHPISLIEYEMKPLQLNQKYIFYLYVQSELSVYIYNGNENTF